MGLVATQLISLAEVSHRAAEKEAINVPQLELEVEEDLARKEQEDRWSGSSKGWLRILGIGVFGLAFLLIFILILGGGYVPSWLRPLLQAIDF
eukprot:s1559_g12.t1